MEPVFQTIYIRTLEQPNRNGDVYPSEVILKLLDHLAQNPMPPVMEIKHGRTFSMEMDFYKD